MKRKRISLGTLLIFCAVFSTGLAGCPLKHPGAPDQTPCLISLAFDGDKIDPGKSGAWCASTADPDNPFWKPLSDLDGFIARSQDDEQKIVEWEKRECRSSKGF